MIPAKWGPLAERLSKKYTVIVPDLRGMGNSSKPASGYDKKSQAGDIRAVVENLGHDHTAVVGHDIGKIMKIYAYAARYPDKVTKLVVMDAPVPGVAPWDEIVLNPQLASILVAKMPSAWWLAVNGSTWTDSGTSSPVIRPKSTKKPGFSTPGAFIARPGAMKAAFAQFNAIALQDVADNRVSSKPQINDACPRSRGRKVLRFEYGSRHAQRSNERRASGRAWSRALATMEESPNTTVDLIDNFLAK